MRDFGLEFTKRSQLFVGLHKRNASRRRDVRQQSKLFALWNQSLRRNPNSNRLS
jgi:hypothetical protein